MATYWGYHMILDCGGCDIDAMTKKKTVKKFLKDLVKSIDMTAIGKPWIERTAIGMPDKEGFSVYQLIVTSNISGHFVDEYKQIYLDVFSCKEFDQVIVKEKVKSYFSPKTIKTKFIIRDADSKEVFECEPNN